MITVTLFPRQLAAGRDTDLTITLTNMGVGTCRNVVFRLDLPPQIVRLAGDGLIEKDRLAAGETVTGSLRVQAWDTGSWPVSSSNFSYRDRHGVSVRPTDYADTLTVLSLAPVREDEPPRFTVDLVSSELPCRQWGQMRVRLTNIGDAAVRNVGLSVDGPFRKDNGGHAAPVVALASGESTELSFSVLANESGAVPVRVNLDCEHGREQTASQQWTKIVTVGEPMPANADMTVLYLSANPVETVRLRVEAELREIRDELRRGVTHRFQLVDRGAVRTRDISDALLNAHPRIVHFSGHGSDDGRLYLERDTGHSQVVTASALAALFSEFANQVQCVIVNACSTTLLAKEIARHIDYVIAMRDKVPDKAAIAFSIGFYQALAAGKTVEEAYRFGRTQIHLQLGDGFADVPLLLRRDPAGDLGARSS